MVIVSQNQEEQTIIMKTASTWSAGHHSCLRKYGKIFVMVQGKEIWVSKQSWFGARLFWSRLSGLVKTDLCLGLFAKFTPN